MTIRVAGICLALSVAASAASRSQMLVSTDWVAKHLKDANVVLLHVANDRTVYDAGHIPGARFVSLPELAITKDGIPHELPPVAELKRIFEAAGVSDRSRVIVYSDVSVLPATRAYFTLDYLGHGDRAALLDGGLGKWRSEGRELSKDVPSAAAGRFTPHPKPELVVQMEAVRKMAGQKSEILLDARAPEIYSGEKGAHIPGALNLYWMETQTSHDDQALKPEADLRKLYEAAGITPDHPVVTYCNSGMQASQSYFTLKYLGYDVRMYDGSMSEWKAKGAPVEK